MPKPPSPPVKAIPKRRPTKAARPPAGAWSVMVIDGRPVRNKAQRDYQKAVRDLEKARAESERFHNEDKPRFAKWVSANFGAMLTEMRELQTKLFEFQQLVEEVEQEYFFGGYRSIAAAYREVIRRRSHPEEAGEAAESAFSEDEEFKREFEEAFEESTREYWEKIGKNGQNRSTDGQLQRPGKNGSRLKELYRALVRRLHPDKSRELTAKQKEWWHLTQAAYEEGNVQQLEVILTLLEVEDKGARGTSVSNLVRLTASFKSSLRSLKRQLTELRRDPAWNFSQRPDHSVLLHQTRLAFQIDKAKIIFLLKKYETQVQRWQKEAESPRQRARSRRRNQWLDQELF